MSPALHVDSWPLNHLQSPFYCYLVQNTSSTGRSQLLNHKVIYSTSSWESAIHQDYSWLWWDSSEQKKDTCSYRAYMWLRKKYCISVQFSSVTHLYPTLCNPMNRSTQGLLVYHQFQEFTQTHVHWIGDAIQPSQPLSSHSPPALNLSPHQGLFKWVSSSHQVAKVLQFQLQHQSYQ